MKSYNNSTSILSSESHPIFASSAALSLEQLGWALDRSAHPNRILHQAKLCSLSDEPLNLEWLYAWASPTAFPGHYPIDSFLTQRLIFLAMLELEALLNSFLEGTLYKCSIWTNNHVHRRKTKPCHQIWKTCLKYPALNHGEDQELNTQLHRNQNGVQPLPW